MSKLSNILLLSRRLNEVSKAGMLRVVYTGFNFLVGLLVAALMGPSGFGILSIMIVNAALLLVLTDFGTGPAIVWHGARQELEGDRLFSVSMYSIFFQLAVYILFALPFFFLSEKLLLLQLDERRFFAAEFIYFAGLVFQEKYISLLYANRRERSANLAMAISTVLVFLVAIYFYFVPGQSSFQTLFLLYAFMPAVQALSLLLVFHWSRKVRLLSLKGISINSFIRFSVLVFFSNVIQFLAYRMDYWVLDYYHGEGEVGVFSQSIRFCQLLWILPGILAAVIYPQLVKATAERLPRHLVGYLRLSNSVHLLLITPILFLCSWLLYRFFLPPGYQPGWQLMLIMIPGYLLFGNAQIIASFFSAGRRLWINFYTTMICFGLIVVTNFLLIPRLGVTGAAWSNTIAYSLAAIFSLYRFSQLYGIPMAQLFFLKRDDLKLLHE